MRGTNRNVLKLLVVGLVAVLGACNPTSLDDPDSAEVILEVFSIPPIPAITSTFDATAGACLFTITSTSVTLRNEPKNSLAGNSPFNDIILQTVDLVYEWDNPGLTATPARTFVIGGTVPAGGGTVAVSFPPIALGDVLSEYQGHTAGVTMTFHGRTIAGKDMAAIGRGAVLSVSSCTGGP